MKKNTVRICMTSLMASLVLVSTFIRIPIPLGEAHTMIHLGNVACILAGFILGPIDGGLASGIGSFMFDILNPGFIMSAPTTFLLKFLMGVICGKVAKSGNYNCSVNVLAAFLGTGSYVVLYSFKNFLKNAYLLSLPFHSNLILIGRNIIISTINAVLAVIIAVPIFEIFKKYLYVIKR